MPEDDAYKLYLSERSKRETSCKDQYKSLDLALLTLSSGAVALIVENENSFEKSGLAIIFFLLSIFFVLSSHLASAKMFESEITALDKMQDEGNIFRSFPESRWRSWVEAANLCSSVTFFSGVLAWVFK